MAYVEGTCIRSEWEPAVELDLLDSHLVSHAPLIGRLEQTGTERSMNFDGATDDASRQRIVFSSPFIRSSSSRCSLCLCVLCVKEQHREDGERGHCGHAREAPFLTQSNPGPWPDPAFAEKHRPPTPFALSLSKGFDRLSPNGLTVHP